MEIKFKKLKIVFGQMKNLVLLNFKKGYELKISIITKR